MTHEDVVARLKSCHFSKKTSLGQHFLLGEEVLARIADTAIANSDANVLEIGPGPGTLTLQLAKRAKRVLCVEIDRELTPLLSAVERSFGNVSVTYGDILKLDVPQICREAFSGERFVVAANLPYYITAPFISGMLTRGLPLDALTLLNQRESALRLLARPGEKNYVYATVLARYYTRPSVAFDVPRGEFSPPPHVDSCVVRMPLAPPEFAVLDERMFFAVARAAFISRRKMLRGNLQAAFSLSRQGAQDVLDAAGIPRDARGETLDLPDFARVADELSKRK